MNRRLLITALAVTLSAPTFRIHSLTAQTAGSGRTAAPAAKPTAKKAAPSCAKPDTSAAWYKRQWATLDETGLKWSNDSLRSALLDAAGLTVATALVPQLGWQNASAPVVVTPAESAMVVMLKRRGGRGGRGRGATPAAPGTPAPPPPSPWPLKSIVGAAGVRAVFVIMQTDSALQESGMHQLMEPGPDEAIAADIAILNDRSRLLVGRKQLFGTQLHLVNGKLVPLPMEDSAHVDLRRSDAGFPPLAWSVCNANSKM
jgi:hypothetical protein